MSQIEKIFIQEIKSKISDNLSPIEEVASILGISYDAAYRRLNGKASFSLSESIEISKALDISLNQLYEVGYNNEYVVKSSLPINNIDDFNTYLINIYNQISPLIGKEEDSLTFSARELPMFYFFTNSILKKYKTFLWFRLLKLTSVNKSIQYKNFIPTESILYNMKRVGEAYKLINRTEIWSYGAINNVLQQTLYLFRMNLLELDDIILITDALKEELQKIEMITQNQNTNDTNNFNLYSNEMMIMDNSMLIKHKGKNLMGYPYALLKFFIIENEIACRDQELFIQEQIRHSSCITNTSMKDHSVFFNNKYKKIDHVLALIKNEYKKPVFL